MCGAFANYLIGSAISTILWVSRVFVVFSAVLWLCLDSLATLPLVAVLCEERGVSYVACCVCCIPCVVCGVLCFL